MNRPGPRSPSPRALMHPLALALVLATSASALAQPAAKKKSLALPELQTWTLDNGMQVAFMPLTTAPAIAVQVWYHVGSKEERRDRRGSAHMFEHMMFKGTEHVRPEDHARMINRVGGYTNAATTEDATFYINALPSSYLDFACQLEAERMRNLMFRDDMITTEREVVKEEIRQQENSPLAKGLLRFLEIAFAKHPYAWTAGGTIADLDNTKVADLKSFYDAYYVPNNAMLVVVGNVTADAVKAAVAKWFAPIPKAAEPPRPADAATEPKQTELRREVVEPGQIGLVLAGFHIPAARHDDSYALQVASLILGGGESSRLHQRLVSKDKIAIQASASMLSREHPGLFAVLGVFLDPALGDKVEAALWSEVERLRTGSPTARELRKAKNQLQAGFVFGLQSADGLARQIGTSWIQTGEPGRWLRDLDKYEAVTGADVQRVAKTYFDKSNATVVVVPPAGAGK